MKKLVVSLAVVAATVLPVSPALAGGSELPPCEEGCTPPPPVCVVEPCETADTGVNLYGPMMLAGGLVVVGSGALWLGRRRSLK